jgi:hypothetical protein
MLSDLPSRPGQPASPPTGRPPARSVLWIFLAALVLSGGLVLHQTLRMAPPPPEPGVLVVSPCAPTPPLPLPRPISEPGPERRTR